MAAERRKTPNVGIYIFEDVESLDFCGALEVFSVARTAEGEKAFDLMTVAKVSNPIMTMGGMKVLPDYTLEECPKLDVLVIPGGQGSRIEKENRRVLEWVRRKSAEAEITLSVCTGALILGRAGLLDGLKACTYHRSWEELERDAPNTEPVKGVRFVDNGSIVTSAGIAAGIEASLHVVAKLLGRQAALDAAAYMEYDCNLEAIGQGL